MLREPEPEPEPEVKQPGQPEPPYRPDVLAGHKGEPSAAEQRHAIQQLRFQLGLGAAFASDATPQPQHLGQVRSQLALALRLSAYSAETSTEDWAGLFRELCRPHSHRSYLDIHGFRAAVRREGARHQVPLHHPLADEFVDQVWASVATPTGDADAAGRPERRLRLADFIRLLSDCPTEDAAAALWRAEGGSSWPLTDAAAGHDRRPRTRKGASRQALSSRLTMCW